MKQLKRKVNKETDAVFCHKPFNGNQMGKWPYVLLSKKRTKQVVSKWGIDLGEYSEYRIFNNI